MIRLLPTSVSQSRTPPAEFFVKLFEGGSQSRILERSSIRCRLRYETMVGQKRRSSQGGQASVLALARAVLKECLYP